MENAVGFPGRNLMVPVPEPEDLASPDARLLSGRDALLGGEHYRRGATVGELLGDDRQAMPPPPAERFDAVRWERRRADREGRAGVDGTPCCAGPYQLLMCNKNRAIAARFLLHINKHPSRRPAGTWSASSGIRACVWLG